MREPVQAPHFLQGEESSVVEIEQAVSRISEGVQVLPVGDRIPVSGPRERYVRTRGLPHSSYSIDD